MIVKSEKKIPLQKLEDAVNVFGNHDENLHFIENDLGVQIVVRDDHLVVSGEMERVEQSTGVLNQLIELSALGNQITLREVQYSIKLVKDGHGEKIGDLATDVIAVTFGGNW